MSSIRAEDKENHYMPVSTSATSGSLQGSFRPLRAISTNVNKATTMGKSAGGGGTGGGRFGRLLADVTNTIRSEEDEVVAVKTQVREAYDVAVEWVQEENDRKVAEDLARRLEEEERAQRLMEASRGESAALAIAMEERKRVLSEAQEKKSIEAKDSEMAKKLVLDDVESDHKFSELLSNDEKYAKDVYDSLQDELYAEELFKQEKMRYEKEVMDRVALLAADEKMARDHQEKVSKEVSADDKRRQEDDYELAKSLQNQLDAKYKQMKSKQELQDSALSKKLAVAIAREDHRQKKQTEWKKSKNYSDFNTVTSIAQQWLDADAEVEDVMDGICLTIILPQLRGLNVKVHSKRTVEIDACRTVYMGEEMNAENSQYCAEFLIDGPNVALTDADVSYEYSYESGMLHLYIEKVHLNGDCPVTDKIEGANSFLSSVKDSFHRMFGKSKK